MSLRIDHDKIIFDCTIDGVRALKDGTISVNIHTQEMNADGAGILFAMNQKYLYAVLKPFVKDDSEINPEDVEALEEFKGDKYDIPKDKSPAKRLRDIVFIKWKKLGSPGQDFDLYYKQRIEKYIEHEKDLINKIDL